MPASIEVIRERKRVNMAKARQDPAVAEWIGRRIIEAQLSPVCQREERS